MFIVYVFVAILFAIGIYAVVLKDNMIKKVIGLGIMGHAIHILIVNIGHKTGGIAPILTENNMLSFVTASVDPLPQALVLTSIVIDFGITVLALSIVIMLYKHFDTLDMKRIRSLRG